MFEQMLKWCLSNHSFLMLLVGSLDFRRETIDEPSRIFRSSIAFSSDSNVSGVMIRISAA